MEAAFEKMKKEHTNNVDNLMQWLKEAKIVEAAPEAENKAKKMFDDVKDKQDVEFQKFKDVVTSLASEQKKSLDDYVKALSNVIPKVQEALSAATAAATAVTGFLGGQSK